MEEEDIDDEVLEDSTVSVLTSMDMSSPPVLSFEISSV
jgi:hypothetical protein